MNQLKKLKRLGKDIQINKKFWPCLNTDKRYVHSYGGRGAGRSHHEALNFIIKLMQPTFFRGVLIREVHDTIRASQFQLLKDIIDEHDLSDKIRVNDARMELFCSETGNSIIAKGLKKSSKNETAKFKSITSITHVWVEEAEEISKEDYQKVDGSIRKEGIKCQLRFTYNTGIEPDHWLRKTFHEPQREDTFYLHCTYLDNLKFLNEDYIRSREEMAFRDPERFAVEVMGEWGARVIVSPFANQYDESKHRKPCEFIPNIPLNISLDFNLDPFAFIYYQYWSDKDGYHFHIFKEETIEGGTISEACNRIKDAFKGHLHTLTITGDYSGTHRQMAEADKASLYKQLLRGLGLRKNQLDIRPNPTHRNSRSDVNYLLMHFPDFRVHPSCTMLDRDLRTVEVSPDGKIIKSDRNKQEQKADHLDAFRYSVNSRMVLTWIRQHQKTNN